MNSHVDLSNAARLGMERRFNLDNGVRRDDAVKDVGLC